MNKKVHKEKVMWNSIKKYLDHYPERLTVARVLVENGLSAKKNSVDSVLAGSGSFLPGIRRT